MGDLHEKLYPIALSITTANLVEFDEKCRKLSKAKGVGSVH